MILNRTVVEHLQSSIGNAECIGSLQRSAFWLQPFLSPHNSLFATLSEQHFRNHRLDHFSILVWNFSGLSVTPAVVFSSVHAQPHSTLIAKAKGTCRLCAADLKDQGLGNSWESCKLHLFSPLQLGTWISPKVWAVWLGRSWSVCFCTLWAAHHCSLRCTGAGCACHCCAISVPVGSSSAATA